MSDITRRNLCIALPAFAACATLALADEKPTAATPQGPAQPQNKLKTDLEHSQTWEWDKMPTRVSGAGAPTRDVCQGRVPTGELVEVHITSLAPGKMPHGLHSHAHEEFIMVKEGTMALILDGNEHPLPAGSVGYTAPNEIHGFKNIGDTPATYFIFSVNKVPGVPSKYVALEPEKK